MPNQKRYHSDCRVLLPENLVNGPELFLQAAKLAAECELASGDMPHKLMWHTIILIIISFTL